MARYERDYGRDFDRWGGRGTSFGAGHHPDARGGNWRTFTGDEGRYGTSWDYDSGHQGGFGYEQDRGGFQMGYGGGQGWDRGFQGGYGGGPDFDRFQGYGGTDIDRGFRGGFGGGRDVGRGHQGGFGQGGLMGRGGYGGTGWDYDRGFGSTGELRGYNAGTRGGYSTGRGWETGYGGGDTGYDTGWQNRGGWGSGREQGFGRSRASQIMTENPEAVSPDATLADVAKKMRDLDVGIIPVIENDQNRRLRGVITDRDIAVRAVAEGKDGKTTVEDCMTDRVRTVNKNDSIHEVMRVMREEQVRRVPVTDRDGRLVGIIAQADLAVDFAGNDTGREIEVSETVERISEPAHPERAGNRMAASGGSSGKKQGKTEGGNTTKK